MLQNEFKNIQIRWEFTINGNCVESDGTKQRQ